MTKIAYEKIGDASRPMVAGRIRPVTAGRLSLAALCVGLVSSPALAAPVLNEDGWSIVWDNTVKYSNAFRTEGVSEKVVSGGKVNGLTADQRDDGDRNFRDALISNRADLLSELDISYQRDFGFRVSAAAWYDTVYNSDTDNNSPLTYNQPGFGSNTEFADKTKQLHGRNIELLDAFAYGSFDIDGMPLNVRVGRYAQLWGESLYFGSNGIAAGMAPLDTIKALSVPGSQVKELIMPVTQVGAQLQIDRNFSFAGYYQLEWRRNRNAAVGSFFSPVDFVDYGGKCLIAAGGFCVGSRVDDDEPDAGQFGFSMKYTPDDGAYSLGLYALRFNAKDPVVYTDVIFTPPFVQDYYLSFPEKIELYGASFTSYLGDANIGAEVSYRRNQPLAYDPNVGLVLLAPLGQVGDGDKNALYPTAETLHAQFSTIYSLPRSEMGLWDGGTITGEFAYNQVLTTDQNASAVDLVDPGRNKGAGAIQVGVNFDYYQIMSGLDLNIGPNVRYGLFGDSLIDPGMTEGSGSASMSANFTYLNVWKLGLSYTHFLGDLSRQPFVDRDFVGFNIQRTF